MGSNKTCTPPQRCGQLLSGYDIGAARRTGCFPIKATCSLQIFTYNETKQLCIPDGFGQTDDEKKKQRRIYLLNNFKHLHNITFTENDKIENDSFPFSYNGSKIRFAARARGINGKFYKMELYYYYCDETLRNDVRLPRTYAPPADELKRVALNCTNNAVTKYNESSFEKDCVCPMEHGILLGMTRGVCVDLVMKCQERDVNVSSKTSPYGTFI